MTDAATSLKPVGSGKLSLEQTILLWRLTRGGVGLDDAIKLLGGKVHLHSARSALGVFTAALNESHAIAGTVRCTTCGGKLNVIPCVCCRRDGYREVRHG